MKTYTLFTCIIFFACIFLTPDYCYTNPQNQCKKSLKKITGPAVRASQKIIQFINHHKYHISIASVLSADLIFAGGIIDYFMQQKTERRWGKLSVCSMLVMGCSMATHLLIQQLKRQEEYKNSHTKDPFIYVV